VSVETTLILNPELNTDKLASEQRKLEQSLGSFNQKSINNYNTKLALQKNLNRLLQEQLTIQNRINIAQGAGQKIAARTAAMSNAAQRGFTTQRLGVAGGKAIGGGAISQGIAQGIAQSAATKGVGSGIGSAVGSAVGAGIGTAASLAGLLWDREEGEEEPASLKNGRLKKQWEDFQKKGKVSKTGRLGRIMDRARGLVGGGGAAGLLKKTGRVGGYGALALGGLYGLGGIAGMLSGKSPTQVGREQNYNPFDGPAESTVNFLGRSKLLQKMGLVDNRGDEEDFAAKEEMLNKKRETLKERARIDKEKLKAKLTLQESTVEETIDTTKTKRTELEKSMDYKIDYSQSHRAGLMSSAGANVKGAAGYGSEWGKLNATEKASLVELKAIKKELEKL